MAVFTIDVAQTILPELVTRAEAGEEIVLTRNGQPVARIIAIGPGSIKRPFGGHQRA
jgi:prevent-host-death family protein